MRALAVILLVGCHDLPDLGICGNGVVEAEQGEACDGGLLCTATCELACGPDGTCADGQRCAIDNICRAPSGQFFAIGDAQLFDIKAARTGDFDGDRVDDLVGVSATSIVVRYGSASGTPFVDGIVQNIASSQGIAAIFDRDPSTATAGESDLSIAIPTDGLALLTSDTTTFYPQIENVFPVPGDVKVRIVVVDEAPNPERSEVIVEINRPDGAPIVPARSDIVEDGVVLVARKPLEACGQNLRLVDIATSADRTTFVVVGRNPDIPNRSAACLYRDLVKVAEVPILGNQPTSAVLANLDADACEELLITRPSGDVTSVEMVDASGDPCTLTAGELPRGTVAGAAELLLAAGPITPLGAPDELVLTSGVYTVGGGLTRFAAPSLDPWTVAAVVDLDRDGNADVVAGRDREDVDVVRGGPDPENRFIGDTARRVTAVVAGDFDGDGFGDAALVEGGVGNDQISLLFGGAGGILGPARANSAIGGELAIARIRRFTWGNTLRGTDAIDDLLVIRATAGAETRSAGVLIGEPTRVLTMPRFPTVLVPSIGAVTVGSFDGTAVLAAAVRATGPDTSELATLDLGADDASFVTRPITGLEVVESRLPQLVRTDGGTLLALLAADPADPESQVARVIDATGAVCTGEVASAGQVHPFDLEGDGDEELVVNLVGRGARAFELTAGASCAIGQELVVDALAGCGDITRVNDTVVAACIVDNRTELYRIVDGAREAEPFGSGDGTVNQLFVGDYTGDGVDDIAVATTRSGVVSVLVFGQCPAHDTRACRD